VTAGAAGGATTAPTTAAPHPLGLVAGVLTLSDLGGGGWSTATAPSAVPQQDLTSGPCGSKLWAHDVAGFQSEYTDNGAGVVETGTVDSSVLEAPTAQAAGDQADFVTSPSFPPCIKAEVAGGMQNELNGTPFQLGQVSVDPLTLDVAMGPKVGYAVTFTLVDQAAQQEVQVTTDHVEIFAGPYEGTLDITLCSCRPVGGVDMLQQETERMAERLAALPPGGTLVGRAA
jgi:hypothetical protein